MAAFTTENRKTTGRETTTDSRRRPGRKSAAPLADASTQRPDGHRRRRGEGRDGAQGLTTPTPRRGMWAGGGNSQPSPAARPPARRRRRNATAYSPHPRRTANAAPRSAAYGFAAYGFAVCASSYAPRVCAAPSDTAHGTACGTVCGTDYDTAKRRCSGRLRPAYDTVCGTEHDTEHDTNRSTPK